MDGAEQYETPSQLLALVGCRYEFLAVLNTEPHTKSGIEDALNISRSTVDRAVRELETGDLVRRTDDGYRTTLYGSTLTAIYDSFLDHLDHVSRAKALLGELPPDVDFNLGVVIDAEIVVAEEPTIYAPAARLTELVKAATELRGLVYADTAPEASGLFSEQLADAGIPAEVVFRQRTYERIEATYPELVERTVNADNCTAYVASGIPFGLFLLTVDGTEYVCLVVYDANQTLKGLIVNDAPEAVAWADYLFEQYRDCAVPLARK